MLKVEFNAEPVDAALADLRGRLEDLTPVFQETGEYLIEATRGRFRAGEAPDGTKWLPKKATTLARYKARGDGNRPDPLIGASRRLSSEIVSYASRSSVEVGSNLEYSAIHQFGGTIAHPGGTPYLIDEETKLARFVRKGSPGAQDLPVTKPHPIAIPARPWLGLSEADERNILAIVAEHLAANAG